MIVFFLNISFCKLPKAHESREDTMVNCFTHHPHLITVDIHSYLLQLCFPGSDYFQASPRPPSCRFIPRYFTEEEPQLLEDIVLAESNPIITPTRLTIITLISSNTQNIRDFPIVQVSFTAGFCNYFCKTEKSQGSCWEADIILFLDFVI